MNTTAYPRRLLQTILLSGLLTACGAGGETDELPASAVDSTATAAETGVVTVDTALITSSGIRIGEVTGTSRGTLLVTGTVTYDANLVSHIGSRTAGRVIALRADLGDQVMAGQVLALLESPEVGQVRSNELEAEALLEIAQENFSREQRLEQQGISSRKELLDATSDLRRAEASLRSARARLDVLGAGHGKGGEFGVTAPFDGVVAERNVTRGEMVDPEDQLFTIADARRVWVQLDIFERDLAGVARGQEVRVTTAAWPDRIFAGKIVYLGATLDSATRTIRARVEVPNADGMLRPGMFATATIAALGSTDSVAVVPQEAVQNLDGRDVVFVPGDHPGEFEARAVVIGEMVGLNMIRILSGIRIGDSIVVAGAFMLRSELAKGEIGEHGH